MVGGKSWGEWMFVQRTLDRAKRHDWFAAFIDIVVVILGIFIALQVNLWVQSRQDRATERGYMRRLLADSDANVVNLRNGIALDEKRAATLSALATSLRVGSPPPDEAALSDVMCRWFLEPSLDQYRTTYSELVSSGRLTLLRDEKLREDLAVEQAAYADAQRLDELTPAVLQASAPLDRYRTWRIVGGGAKMVGCDFDIAGMRADPVIPSVLAQLYRDQTIHADFRRTELTSARATRARLTQLLGRTTDD